MKTKIDNKLDNKLDKNIDNKKETSVNIDIDNLTAEQLEALMAKYNLKKGKEKSSDTPSFQVIRGRAIRCATKTISSEHNVVQKAVKLLDTHKVSDVDNNRHFEVLLKCEDVTYKVDVVVDILSGESVTTNVEVSELKNLQ